MDITGAWIDDIKYKVVLGEGLGRGCPTNDIVGEKTKMNKTTDSF